MKRLWCEVLLTGLTLLSAFQPTTVQSETGGAVITLISGDVVQGRITSENDTQVVIEESNANRTIFSSRSVSKSEIKSIQRPSAEATNERLAYEAVLRYRLIPDQEFTVAQYDAGITACQKFLEIYPTAEHAEEVRQLGIQLKQEKEQIEKELVKFGGRWMSAGLKAAEQDLSTSYSKLQQTKWVLAGLEKQRDQTKQQDAAANAQLLEANEKCGTISDDHARKACLEQYDIMKLEHNRRARERQELLASLESRIQRTQENLNVAQRSYEVAEKKRDGMWTEESVALLAKSKPRLAANTDQAAAETAVVIPNTTSPVAQPASAGDNAALPSLEERLETTRYQREQERQSLAEQQREAQRQHREKMLSELGQIIMT